MAKPRSEENPRKPKAGEQGNKLFSKQQTLIENYARVLHFEDGMPQLANPALRPLRDMIAELPWCTTLGDWDIYLLLLEGITAFIEHAPAIKNLTGKVNSDADLAILVVYLCSEFESLPRKYVVHITFPSMALFGGFGHEISPRMTLTSMSEKGPAVGAASETKNSLLARLLTDQVRPASCTLEITCHGYASSYVESPAISEAISLAKQFSYLCHATGVTDRHALDIEVSTCWVTSKYRNLRNSVTLPEGLAKMFGSLVFRPSAWPYTDMVGAKTLLGNSRPPEGDEESIIALGDMLMPVRNFFNTAGQIGRDRICAAIEWYEDSLVTKDQTIAFLSACIGLESILGGDDLRDELTNRLTDRCAFLLGRNREERAQYAKDFRDVLTTRGQLVHARQARLSARDRRMLDLAQEMLYNCIRKEIQPLI